MLHPWRTGKIIRMVDETPTTRRFWIQVPELESFDFKPGQFVTLDLPIHEAKNKRWRSYSIASWPDGTNVFELVIVQLEGGLGTQYLFNEVTLGSEVTFRGPQGVFTLPEMIEKDLFLICTGTGIAPFRSMVHYLLNSEIPHKDVYLIFGCRTLSDSLYANELKEIEERAPWFRFMPAYSREKPADGLITGYVHGVYEKICLDIRTKTGLQVNPANFYLCGWKNMIDEAMQRLQALGYERKEIHRELYG